MVLMWIENLALHMAERDTSVWQICITVKKKPLIPSVVDSLHPECFVLLQLCRHVPYSNAFGYYETFMIFKNSGRYPETLFSKIFI